MIPLEYAVSVPGDSPIVRKSDGPTSC